MSKPVETKKLEKAVEKAARAKKARRPASQAGELDVRESKWRKAVID